MINDILRKDQKILFLLGVGIFPLLEFVGHNFFHECLGLDALYGTIFGFNPYYFPLAPIIYFIISSALDLKFMWATVRQKYLPILIGSRLVISLIWMYVTFILVMMIHGAYGGNL